MNRYGHLRILAPERKYVAVDEVEIHQRGFLKRGFNGRNAVAQLRGKLEVEGLPAASSMRRRRPVKHLGASALQKELHVHDRFLVLRRLNHAAARRRALPELMIDAGPLLFKPLARALAQGK